MQKTDTKRSKMEAVTAKLTLTQCAEKAREGLVRKKEERQELFLAGYDVGKTLIENLIRVGINYSSFYQWIEDEEFKIRYDKKRKESLELAIQKVEDVAFKSAIGEIFTTTSYFKTVVDEESGEVKDVPNGKAVYQQQPSYKHAELMLKAHKPEIYGSTEQSTGQVTINLNVTGGTDSALEINAIDVSHIKRLEDDALKGGDGAG